MTTLTEILEQLERRAADAERYKSTAPVDVVLRSVIEDFRDVDTDGAEPNGTEPDQLLTIDKAAELLSVAKRWLYDNHHRLPFTRRIGRQLRFSMRGLQRYMRRRR